jgi:hypothetical protein
MIVLFRKNFFIQLKRVLKELFQVHMYTYLFTNSIKYIIQ